MARDSVMSGTLVAVRVLAVLNVVAGIGFAIALLATWPGAGLLASRLAAKYHHPATAYGALIGIRVLMILGILAVAPLYRLFAALLAIVETSRGGDPFLPDNAARVRTIAWALLALQLIDLALGGISLWLSSLHVDVATWTPSIMGWLSVLVAFVLARVFARGTAMRDDLAATV